MSWIYTGNGTWRRPMDFARESLSDLRTSQSSVKPTPAPELRLCLVRHESASCLEHHMGQACPFWDAKVAEDNAEVRRLMNERVDAARPMISMDIYVEQLERRNSAISRLTAELEAWKARADGRLKAIRVLKGLLSGGSK